MPAIGLTKPETFREESVLSFGRSTSQSIHARFILTSDSITNDKSPLPPAAATEEEEAILLQDEAYVDGPIKIDYGFNVRYAFEAFEPPKYI